MLGVSNGFNSPLDFWVYILDEYLWFGPNEWPEGNKKQHSTDTGSKFSPWYKDPHADSAILGALGFFQS